MKRTTIGLLALCALLQAGAAEVNWLTDLPKAQAQAKNLVLLEVDFPRRKEQSAELKKANKGLGSKYKVGGYPTFVVLDKDGKEVGRQEGYAPGGPKAFIAKLDGFKAK